MFQDSIASGFNLRKEKNFGDLKKVNEIPDKFSIRFCWFLKKKGWKIFWNDVAGKICFTNGFIMIYA
jgi:hypothetical protein